METGLFYDAKNGNKDKLMWGFDMVIKELRCHREKIFKTRKMRQQIPQSDLEKLYKVLTAKITPRKRMSHEEKGECKKTVTNELKKLDSAQREVQELKAEMSRCSACTNQALLHKVVIIFNVMILRNVYINSLTESSAEVDFKMNIYRDAGRVLNVHNAPSLMASNIEWH